MLVLSRKQNESIVIDDRIKVCIVEIRGDKVRLGVEAPKEVPVHRQEVYDAIHRDSPPLNVGATIRDALTLLESDDRSDVGPQEQGFLEHTIRRLHLLAMRYAPEARAA